MPIRPSSTVTIISIILLVMTLVTVAPTAQAASVECETDARDYTACLATNLAIANDQLQTTYQALTRRLTANTIGNASASEKSRRLSASQTAWIAYREADCDLQNGEMRGTSSEVAARTQCLLDKTEERLQSLRTLN